MIRLTGGGLKDPRGGRPVDEQFRPDSSAVSRRSVGPVWYFSLD